MILWQANLGLSRATQCWAGLMHTLLLLAVVWVPWPMSRWLACPPLLSLVVLDGITLQRRITNTQGKIVLLSDYHVAWQAVIWRLAAAPLVTPWGVWLQLQDAGRWQRLWLAANSMTTTEWRALCRVLRHLYSYS